MLSNLFDPQWYGERRNSSASGSNLIVDYLTHGWRELVSPHPLVDVRYYLSTYPDVAEARIDPLTHFVTAGWREGRNPHPLFRTSFYLSQPGLELGELNPLVHYLLKGWREGRKPNPFFDPEDYLRLHPDVRLLGLEPLTHYVTKGVSEGRAPARGFDSWRYRNRFGLGDGLDPFSVFVDRNGEEGIDLPSSSRSSVSSLDINTFKLDLTLPELPAEPEPRAIGVFVHIFYDTLAVEMARAISQVSFRKHIYVTTDLNAKAVRIRAAFAEFGLADEVTIEVVPNGGFDIAPFLFSFNRHGNKHDLCVKIHAKKSLHNAANFGYKWRNYLLRELMGSSSRVNKIVAAFQRFPDIGILIPEHWSDVKDWVGIGDNLPLLNEILGKVGLVVLPDQDITYAAGSMFWFRSDAIRVLVQAAGPAEKFQSHANDRDKTMAHAIERSILFFAAVKGYKWSFLPVSAVIPDSSIDEQCRRVRESGLFDEVYYNNRYPDVPSAGADPVHHWVGWGAVEGRDPSASFDTDFYRRLMQSLGAPDINPILHYIEHGLSAGLPTIKPSKVSAVVKTDDLYASWRRAESHPDYVEEAFPLRRSGEVKVIAFYFPQFHPFDENDRFWGRGFTEWTNTTKAIPMFPDHYQPRLPGELGFYDTRLKEVLVRQIELAKQYGVHGFCFHHYFFDGKPIMRAPYNLMLANPDLDIPFCLHWANEPWTVRWDGLAKQTGTLLDQRHDPEDDLRFFADIEPALRDPRYIRVDGRPLLVIYRPGLFPDMAATIERWGECCRKAGLPRLYLVVMQTGFEGAVDPRKYGFDAAIEYPPHNIGAAEVNREVDLYDPGFAGTIYDYGDAADRALGRQMPEYTLFRGIMPEWDCTPRRTNPSLFINCSPDRYRIWLEGIASWTDAHHKPAEKLIFVNAWNEWAEGAYLEPDRRYGYAYLDATSNAVNTYARESPQPAWQPSILIGIHLFYTDLTDEFIEHLRFVPRPFDLVLTTRVDEADSLKRKVLEQRIGNLRDLHVVGVENWGRDFAPFMFHFLPRAQGYDLACWMHSKKSPYDEGYSGWRSYLVDNLMGSEAEVETILETFVADESLGLLFPKPFPPVADKVEWGSNFKLTSELLGRLGIHIDKLDTPRFPTAAMFWFRPAALAAWLDLGLTREDFLRHADGPKDAATGAIIDGTISHALERMALYTCESRGFSWREYLSRPYSKVASDR